MAEPQNGRIGGGVLKDNLERQGVDLNFKNLNGDTALLHLDVNNMRIGVNTEAPGFDLELPTDFGSSNLIATTAAIDTFDISNSRIDYFTGTNLLLSSTENTTYDINWTEVRNQLGATSAGITTGFLHAFLTTVSPTGFAYGDIDQSGTIAGSDILLIDLYIATGSTGNATADSFLEDYFIPELEARRAGDPATYNSAFIITNYPASIEATSIATDDLLFDYNTISTRTTNTNIEVRPNGIGTAEIFSNWNITGGLHSTGDITFGGNLTLGDSDQDDVIFSADVNSDIIPDSNNTYMLGSDTKRWLNIYSNLLNGQRVEVGTFVVEDTSLALRQGNIFYVSTLGDDTNVGDHQHGAFRTLKHALDVVDASSAGPVTIHIFPGEYEEEFPLTIPPNTSIRGEDIRNTIIKPTVATQNKDAFLLEGDTTVADITIKDFFYDSGNDTGYAFRFTPNGLVNTRSPYIRNVTVITQGSVTSASDPRGFLQGDAGKGALIDGNELNSATIEGSMLFHSATFITPGVDAITLTNGVRVEWLNSFTYFANRSLYATQGLNGLGGNGLRFGAEIRSIGSASVYGNFGAVADGADTLMYLIGHNFAYIGSANDVTNDSTLTIEANEAVELNSGKINYTSIDAEGKFKVGESFFADFETGTTSIDASTVDFSGLSEIVIRNGFDTTYIDGTRIDTGNIRISGNTIDTIDGELILSPVTEIFTTSSNAGFVVANGNDNERTNTEGSIRYNTETNLFEGYSTGNLSFGGVYSDDRNTSVTAHNTNNSLIFTAGSATTGVLDNTTFSLLGLSDGDILFDTNTIETTLSNSDLELVPDGTGLISAFDLEIFSENISNTTNNNLALATTGEGYVKFDTTTGLVIPFGGNATQSPFFSIVSYDPSGPVIVEIDVSQYSPVAGAWVSDGFVTSNGQSKTVLGATYDGVAETVSIEISSSFTIAPSASDVVTARGLIWDDDASTTLFEPQIGDSRYNTDELYLETWNGESWQRSAGEGEEVTADVLKELVDIYTLVLG